MSDHAAPATQPAARVEGWGAIAKCVSTRTGFEVSIAAAQRYARWPEDPLPVRRWGRARRHVVAEVAAVEAWCDRQWRDNAADAAGATRER